MEGHQQFGGSAWDDGCWRRFHAFNALQFGLAPAGYIFSKVMRAVVTDWGSKGYKVVMFLDDGLTGRANLEDAREQSDSIQSSLKNLRF